MLSDREIAVLGLVAEGSTTKEIARVLGITPRTVEFHQRNIKDRLGAATLASAVHIAHKRDILDNCSAAEAYRYVRQLRHLIQEGKVTVISLRPERRSSATD